MSALRAATLLDSIPNDISEISNAIRSFSASAAAISGSLDQYKEKWVGVYNGQIEAVADSFDQLTAAIQTKHIPANETLIKYVGLKEMTLIL
jgi:hypothetical protein